MAGVLREAARARRSTLPGEHTGFIMIDRLRRDDYQGESDLLVGMSRFALSAFGLQVQNRSWNGQRMQGRVNSMQRKTQNTRRSEEAHGQAPAHQADAL